MTERGSELAAFKRDGVGYQPLYVRLLGWPPTQKIAYLCADLIAITIAHTLALHLIEYVLRAPAAALNPLEYHRYYIPFFAVVLFLFDGYKSPEMRRPEQELEKGFKAITASFLALVLFNFVIFRSEVFSRYLFVSWFVIACILLLTLRFMMRALWERFWNLGLARRRALLVGSPAGLAAYRQLLSTQRHNGYDIVGVLWDTPIERSDTAVAQGLPDLGNCDHWEDVVARTGADLLIVASPAVPDAEEWLRRILHRSKELRINVELYSSVLATANLSHEHDEFSGCFRFYAKAQWSLALERIIKRAIDIGVGLIGSVVVLLMMPIIWVLLKFEDGGPVFYKREFVGCDGKIHHYLKFRTMLQNADDILRRDPELKARYLEQHKLKDDPRMLRIGKFLRKYSLDEFPQFFSVLVGDLTFVGPRVISSEEKCRYGELLSKLLSFKPGLTGFWQVMGRQTTTYQERIQMDMFYIDRWSIWLDLVIIAKTFWKVIRAEGAF